MAELTVMRLRELSTASKHQPERCRRNQEGLIGQASLTVKTLVDYWLLGHYWLLLDNGG